jgi:hypothetical protein
MTATAPTVVGLDRLESTLARFGATVADLPAATHLAAADPVLTLAAARARRQSGQLAASFTAQPVPGGATVGSPVVYAAVQELGWPGHGISPSWALTGALGDSADAVADAYLAAVDAALANVKGA